MAERAAAKKRKRMIFGVVAFAAVGAAATSTDEGRGQEEAGAGDPGRRRPLRRARQDRHGRVLELRDRQPRSTSACSRTATRSSSGSRAPTSRSKKTYSDTLTTDCVPKLEGARGASSGLEKDMPAGLKPPFDKYVASLPKMQAGIESYAEKLKTRGAVKDVDRSSRRSAARSARRHAGVGRVREVPGVRDPRPGQEEGHPGRARVPRRDCKKDPVPFMTKVRTDCGALVQNVDKDAKPSPSKTFKANSRSSSRRISASCRPGRLRQVVAQGQEGSSTSRSS